MYPREVKNMRIHAGRGKPGILSTPPCPSIRRPLLPAIRGLGGSGQLLAGSERVGTGSSFLPGSQEANPGGQETTPPERHRARRQHRPLALPFRLAPLHAGRCSPALGGPHSSGPPGYFTYQLTCRSVKLLTAPLPFWLPLETGSLSVLKFRIRQQRRVGSSRERARAPHHAATAGASPRQRETEARTGSERSQTFPEAAGARSWGVRRRRPAWDEAPRRTCFGGFVCF